MTFATASQEAETLGYILKLLEKEARRTVRMEARRIKAKIARFIDKTLDFYVCAGIVALGTLGFAAAFQLLKAPEPVTQAAAIIGVAVALGRAITRK